MSFDSCLDILRSLDFESFVPLRLFNHLSNCLSLQNKTDASYFLQIHEITLGMDYLHSRDVIHGDLKVSGLVMISLSLLRRVALTLGQPSGSSGHQHPHRRRRTRSRYRLRTLVHQTEHLVDERRRSTERGNASLDEVSFSSLDLFWRRSDAFRTLLQSRKDRHWSSIPIKRRLRVRDHLRRNPFERSPVRVLR